MLFHCKLIICHRIFIVPPRLTKQTEWDGGGSRWLGCRGLIFNVKASIKTNLNRNEISEKAVFSL